MPKTPSLDLPKRLRASLVTTFLLILLSLAGFNPFDKTGLIAHAAIRPETGAGGATWTRAVAGYSTRLYVDEAYDPNLVSMEVNFGDGTSGTSTEW